jgi:CubicO group peptidase (beta-lactamase class C family)
LFKGEAMLCYLLTDDSTVPNNGPAASVPWWSFTKTVLAATALTLVRDRLIGLDDTLDEGPFSLRQLLRHQAGLGDYSELADYHSAVASGQQPWPAAEMLQRLDAGRLRYVPGAGWGYSNVGYLYVGQLIERLTGLNLELALTQRVFEPLGCGPARLATLPADLHGVAMGSASNYHPGWVYHGLLVGPLQQAALLLQRLFGGDLLGPELLAQMQATHTLGGPIPGRPWQAAAYGLGLMHGPAEGLVLSGHTGGGPGSVIAVYRAALGGRTASCAVFADGEDQGAVEARAVEMLMGGLGH